MGKPVGIALAAALFMALGRGIFPQVDELGVWLQMPLLQGLAHLVSHAGDTFAFVLAGVCTVILYRRRSPRLPTFLLLLAGQHLLMLWSKEWFHTHRPEQLHQVSGYAYPSGHTLTATCVYGYLGDRVGWRRGWVVLPLAVAWSRVALGGLLLGWLWLEVCRHLDPEKETEDTERGTHSAD